MWFAVSSSSESSSDSDSSSGDEQRRRGTKQTSQDVHKTGPTASPDDESASQSPLVATRQTRQDPEQAFEAFYLKQTTKEFSEDLEKLRSANDFRGQRSVELLVGALKQGVVTFSKDERKGAVRDT